MNILRNRLSMLLLAWLLSISFLFYITEQEKPAEQKFAFIKLFYSFKARQFPPLMPEAKLYPVEKVEHPLLPKGHDAGSGSMGKPRIEYEENGNLTLIIPYEGTLTMYNSANFIKGTVRARVLNFPGTWDAEFLHMRLTEKYCARLVQMVAHKNELRCSISASYGMDALIEEVRYTDSEIIIRIRPKIPATQ